MRRRRGDFEFDAGGVDGIARRRSFPRRQRGRRRPARHARPAQANSGDKTTLAQVIDIQVLPDGSEQSCRSAASRAR
jgi:hypothetical protein